MRSVLGLAVLILVAGCGGGDSGKVAESTAEDVSLEVTGVPAEQVTIRTDEKPGGPPRGWWVGGESEFFVDAPAQTVDDPAKLTFTIDADSFDDVTRGQVDQLGVYLPGGLLMGPSKSLQCRADGRADPDPCIASAEFLDNGDGRIVVLSSNPSTPR